MSSFFVLNLEPLTVQTLLTILITVTLLGGLLAGSYVITHLKQGYDPSLLFTLLIMPLVVSIVVLLVSNNLARAFSLAGVFTLVRFRLAMRDASDLVYILAAVGIGLALALGYVLLGIIITLFLSLILTLFSWLVLLNQMPYGKLTLIFNEDEISLESIEKLIQPFTDFLKLLQIQTDALNKEQLVFKMKLKKEGNYQELIKKLKEQKGLITIKIQEGFNKQKRV